MNPNSIFNNKSKNVRTNGIFYIPTSQNPKQKILLVAVIVNTKGGSSNQLRIYDANDTIKDNDDYRKATLDTVNTLGRVEYGILMENGIYCVLETGTAADLTIVYETTP